MLYAGLPKCWKWCLSVIALELLCCSWVHSVFLCACACLHLDCVCRVETCLYTHQPPPPPPLTHTHTHILVQTFNRGLLFSPGILHPTVDIHFRVFADHHGLSPYPDISPCLELFFFTCMPMRFATDWRFSDNRGHLWLVCVHSFIVIFLMCVHR